MIGNVIILGIAVSIIIFAKKVFWSDLAKNSFCLWVAIGLSFILIFSILLPNLEFIKSPFTPEINGKVLDDGTNKPIPGATVIIDWGYSYGGFPMYSSTASIKQLIIETNYNGEYNVPMYLKCLAINFFPVYSREISDVNIMVLHHDYKYGTIKNIINNNEIVKMTKYTNIDELRKDNYNMKILAESESRRGLRNIAAAINNLISRQDKILRSNYGKSGGKI